MPRNVQLSEIESALNLLARKEKDKCWDGRDWTRMIKKQLISLAEAHGCEAYASQCENGERAEWLYDVVWLRAGEGQYKGMLTDSPLVAEIEWARPEAVMDDFQKLLLARADTRLMIFEATNTTLAEKHVDKLIRQVRAYSRTGYGDRYIFACLDNCRAEVKPYNFRCQEYVHQG